MFTVWRETPRWQPPRKCGSQYYTHKELNSANNLSNLGKRFFLGSFLWASSDLPDKHPVWKTLCFSLVRLKAEDQVKTAWTSDLQNRETINEWCFNLQIYDNLLCNNRNLNVDLSWICSLSRIIGQLPLGLMFESWGEYFG